MLIFWSCSPGENKMTFFKLNSASDFFSLLLNFSRICFFRSSTVATSSTSNSSAEKIWELWIFYNYEGKFSSLKSFIFPLIYGFDRSYRLKNHLTFICTRPQILKPFHVGPLRFVSMESLNFHHFSIEIFFFSKDYCFYLERRNESE